MPFSMASTSSAVGGITGIPSVQSLSDKNSLTALRPIAEESMFTVNTSVGEFSDGVCWIGGSEDVSVSPEIMASIAPSTI